MSTQVSPVVLVFVTDRGDQVFELRHKEPKCRTGNVLLFRFLRRSIGYNVVEVREIWSSFPVRRRLHNVAKNDRVVEFDVV